jgi:membrane protein implicated in regulation of membrane protease activity
MLGVIRSFEPAMLRRFTEPPFATYVVAHLPWWTAALLVAWVLVALFGVDLWVGAVLAATVMVKDVLSYRTMRRYYTPEPAERRLVDHGAVAVTPLAPQGLVRVRGELWQARVASVEKVPEGTLVRVRDVQGLLLIVERVPDPR